MAKYENLIDIYESWDLDSLIDEAYQNIERIVIKSNRHFDYVSYKLNINNNLDDII